MPKPSFKLQLLPDYTRGQEAFGYIRAHSSNARDCRNVRMRLVNEDFRPAFVFDDVTGLNLTEVQAEGKSLEKNIYIKE